MPRVVGALHALEPLDLVLLELSMERGLSDEELAQMFGSEPAEMARRRGAAILKVARALGMPPGPEIASLRASLEDPGTWDELRRATAGGRGPRSGRSRTRVVVGAAGAAALAGALAAAVWLPGDGDGEGRSPEHGAREGPTGAGEEARLFVPDAGSTRAMPFPSSPARAARHVAARLPARAVLRDRPGGRRLAAVEPRTEWGSPKVLGVVARRGGWIGVVAPELPNGRVGWVAVEQAELQPVRYSLHADLSARRLVVRRDGRRVRRLEITVGGPETPTPTGRFAVTDKLLVRDPDSPYGCCVLAFSGHQPRLPPNWPGGDRLAVHATRDPGDVGSATSYGCFRVLTGEARWLVETVPLGAPVFIRS